MTEDDKSRFITGPEAAALLGVHINTILNLRKRGALTDLRLPGLSTGKYLRSEVEALAFQGGNEEAELDHAAGLLLAKMPHSAACIDRQTDRGPYRCVCWKDELRREMVERYNERLTSGQ